MPARIFYLGAPSRVYLPPDSNPQRAIQETGGNTGNLLIGDAIRKHLRTDCFFVPEDLPSPEYAAEKFDRIVIGASNFLYREFDFAQWANFVEATRLPCTVFGLGAQAPDYGAAVEVPVGTQRFLKVISERSTTLGVRGHWSASILAGLGITNVRVIGCPAMYWTCRPALELKTISSRRPLAVAVNGAAGCVMHASDVGAAKTLEAQLARLSFKRGYPYFLQNEIELAAIGADLPGAFESYRIQLLMQQYGLCDIGPRKFIKFVKQQTRIFFDLEKWHAAMKQFDFVIGSRFHGCLMGLLAGVPCFVYAQDARTRELCELLQSPHTLVEKAGPVDIDAVYGALDLKPLERAYRELYANYISFLEENGFEHNLLRPGQYLETEHAASSGAELGPVLSAATPEPRAVLSAGASPLS